MSPLGPASLTQISKPRRYISRRARSFTLERLNGDYHVQYICEDASGGGAPRTLFRYREWADGFLDERMKHTALEKLRWLVERDNIELC